MIKVNNKCFTNNYDATKYVVHLVSKGELVKIRNVKSCDGIESYTNKVP